MKSVADNKWNVIDGPFVHNGRKVCYCICDCGTEALVNEYDLVNGKSIRCRSCSSKLVRKSNRDRSYAFIVCRKRLLSAAQNAISRCTNKDHKRYADWGGRGIKVCDLWINDIVLFVEYIATLDGHDDINKILDRIDNDGHYEPGNLRFATRSDSQKNQRHQGGEHKYYIKHNFARCFKNLHDRGISFKDIGKLYCVQQSTIRNVVRELEGINA